MKPEEDFVPDLRHAVLVLTRETKWGRYQTIIFSKITSMFTSRY